MSEPEATCVYAVVPAERAVPLDPTVGVSGEPVRVLSFAARPDPVAGGAPDLLTAGGRDRAGGVD